MRGGAGSRSRDQRVTVERESFVADGGGGGEKTWTSQGMLWARVEAARGQERVIADRHAGTQSYDVTVPNDGIGATLTTADRLVWGSIVLNVRQAPDAGRAVVRKLVCEEGVPS